MTGPLPLRVDLHTHTYYSPDGIMSPQRFVTACRRKGLSCVAVTDHNTIRGAQAVREIADFRVIIGEEIRTTAGEIMGLFLTEEVPRGLSPRESIERVKAQGALVGVPHPYDRLRIALRQKEMEGLLERLDFIEVFNARIVFPHHNERARRLAEAHGLAMTAGSDAHSPWELGGAYVEVDEFDGPDAFLQVLRGGKVRGRLSNPLVHLISRYARMWRWLGWRPP